MLEALGVVLAGVQFGDHHGQLVHPQTLGQLRMLPRLPAARRPEAPHCCAEPTFKTTCAPTGKGMSRLIERRKTAHWAVQAGEGGFGGSERRGMCPSCNEFCLDARACCPTMTARQCNYSAYRISAQADVLGAGQSQHGGRSAQLCAGAGAGAAPREPSTTKSAASAWAAPAIILGTKSRCPGASSSTTACRGVLKRAVATSTVTPLARSSGLRPTALVAGCAMRRRFLETVWSLADPHDRSAVQMRSACAHGAEGCGALAGQGRARRPHLSSSSQAHENDAFPALAASVWLLCTCKPHTASLHQWLHMRR